MWRAFLADDARLKISEIGVNPAHCLQSLELLYEATGANSKGGYTAEDEDGMLKAFLANFQAASRQFVKRQLTWFRSDPTFRWVQAGKGADEKVMEEIMLGESEYHSLYGSADEQEAMRQSESNKEDMRALKMYQTKLTVYNSVQKRVALLRGLEEKGLLASRRPPPSPH